MKNYLSEDCFAVFMLATNNLINSSQSLFKDENIFGDYFKLLTIILFFLSSFQRSI
jgi:hypothetical protein